MQSPQSVPPARIFAEALGLGGSLGLLHAIMESTLLGLNGIRSSAVDLAIVAASAVGAAAGVAVLVALAGLIPPVRKIVGADRGLPAFRCSAWILLATCYWLVFAKIITYWSGWGAALLWSLPAAPAFALGAFAVLKKGHRALTPLCASALVAATLSALHLAYADWGHEPAAVDAFAARLLFPVGLAFVMLLAVVKTTRADRPFEPMVRSAWLLAVLVALWAGFWAYTNSGTRLESLFAGAGSAANPSRPNVLLIVLDTVRADHLDLFGYERETMPNLKRFAREEAQIANRTLTPGSWTVPSHASMFTGLYPSAHGAHYPSVSYKDPDFLAFAIREDVPTLAEFLRSTGYQTAGIGANYAMLPNFGLSRGFDHHDVTPGPSYFAERILWIYRFHLGALPSAGDVIRSRLPLAVQSHSRMFSIREPDYRRAWEINTLAQQWLEQHGGRPFFLFLNYMDAHDPYLPLPEDDERFVKRPPGEEWLGFPTDRYDASVRGQGEFTAEEIEYLKGQYDAELVSLDRELGRLFDYLRGAGFLENTLVFITPDHGEAFFEHGFPEHGNSVYQPEIDGFLFIKAPPSLGPVQAAAAMQAVDILPTIAAVMGEPLAQAVQGAPWGNGRDYALSEVFCKSCACESFGSTRWPDALRRDQITVMIHGDKLVRSTDGPDEVYDVKSDPAESQARAVPDAEFLRRAGAILAKHAENRVEGVPERLKDKNMMDKLRSLGYIQ